MHSVKALEELRGIANDVLVVASFSDSQITQALLSRVNGTNVKQIIVAALSVARSQAREIEELEPNSRTRGAA
jgi:hypothetical protein